MVQMFRCLVRSALQTIPLLCCVHSSSSLISIVEENALFSTLRSFFGTGNVALLEVVELLLQSGASLYANAMPLKSDIDTVTYTPLIFGVAKYFREPLVGK
jgi:hypothetical protein